MTQSSARQPLDLYATDPEVALAMCQRLAAEIDPPDVVIEPSAGPGRFVAAARKTWPGARIIAIDVDGAHREACLAAGADEFHECDWPTWVERFLGSPRATGRVLILGNPPYSHAQAHVEAALRLLRRGEHLVFLLRQAFRGAQKRVAWWRTSPLEEVALILPRPRFVAGGDQCDYEAFRWTKGITQRATIAEPILWGSALAEDRAAREQLQLVGRSA